MYSYDILLNDISMYEELGGKVSYFGSSENGRLIPAILIGNESKPAVMCIYGTHAREHITCALSRIHILKYISNPPRNFCLYFVPMLNPDGVELCLKGLGSVKDFVQRKYLLKINNNSTNFSLWKANIKGVDLNTNFPAKWGMGICNKNSPGPSDYIGEKPLSEKENLSLYNFTNQIKPVSVLSFHCKGEEIFWRFYQEGPRLKRDEKIAQKLSDRTGYKLVNGFKSCGGYKDWCICDLKIPAFTLEIGDDKFEHPFPYSEMDQISKKTIDIIDVLIAAIKN